MASYAKALVIRVERRKPLGFANPPAHPMHGSTPPPPPQKSGKEGFGVEKPSLPPTANGVLVQRIHIALQSKNCTNQ